MELTIQQNCPSCGAAIVLHEDDRLVRCQFCDVQNYKVGPGGDRFVLPVKTKEERGDLPLIYVPYLRFKGSIFYVQDKEVKHKIIDTTRVGLEASRLPVSLGLRPQAMQINPVIMATTGSFIEQSEPTRAIFIQAAKIIDLFNDSSTSTTHHRAFIGETISRIYQPFYIRDDLLYDGVDDRLIGDKNLIDPHLEKICASKKSWEPRFISTLCPGCGGLLDGERDAIVLQCCNCALLWREGQGRFARVNWQVVASRNPQARYLPFWKIRFSTDNNRLKSFGDFLRFTNQPLVVQSKHDSYPLTFWIPAFKVNPKIFLQISAQLTVAQLRLPPAKPERLKNDHPVTLPESEGIQAIKSVLAQTTLNRENHYPLLAELVIEEPQCTLTYLPFASQIHDLVQEHTLASLQTAAIRYGRSL